MTAKPNIWKWIMHSQKDDEQTTIRTEQEQTQKRSTKPRKRKNIIRDINLSKLKDSYEQKLINVKQYQKRVRAISYTYIDVLDTATYSDDSD